MQMQNKMSELEIKKSREKLENEVLARTAQLRNANEKLTKIIREKTRTEKELSKRQEALEAIYAIETTFSDSIENSYDQIVLAISGILRVSYTAAGEIDKNKFKIVSQFDHGTFSHEKPSSVILHPMGIVFQKKAVFQFTGNLQEAFSEQIAEDRGYSSYIGVPILSKEGKLIGAICAMDESPAHFSESDVHLIEIFARYLGHEIQHAVMEERLSASKEMTMLGLLTSGVAHEVRNPCGKRSSFQAAWKQSGVPSFSGPYKGAGAPPFGAYDRSARTGQTHAADGNRPTPPGGRGSKRHRLVFSVIAL